MTLLRDPVSTVRRASYKGASRLLVLLYDMSLGLHPDDSSTEPLPENFAELGADYMERVIRAYNNLRDGTGFRTRISWVELCEQLLVDIPRPLFEQHFMEGVLRMTSDPVSNVRVAVGALFASCSAYDSSTGELKAESTASWLLTRPDIKECIIRLSVDDQDVYCNVKKLHFDFPDIEFLGRSCRGCKQAPGGADPVRIVHSADEVPVGASVSKGGADSACDIEIAVVKSRSYSASAEDLSAAVAPIDIDHARQELMQCNPEVKAAGGASVYWARIDEVPDEIEPPLEAQEAFAGTSSSSSATNFYDDEDDIPSLSNSPVVPSVAGSASSVSGDAQAAVDDSGPTVELAAASDGAAYIHHVESGQEVAVPQADP